MIDLDFVLPSMQSEFDARSDLEQHLYLFYLNLSLTYPIDLPLPLNTFLILNYLRSKVYLRIAEKLKTFNLALLQLQTVIFKTCVNTPTQSESG